jgi:hypothetical protein
MQSKPEKELMEKEAVLAAEVERLRNVFSQLPRIPIGNASPRMPQPHGNKVLFVAQRRHWIDPRSTLRRNHARG